MSAESQHLDSVATTDNRGSGPQATLCVVGVRVDSISVKGILDAIENAILDEGKVVIGNVNASALNLAYDLSWFRTFLHGCHIVFCDGFGVKWGARLLGLSIAYRSTPPDWIVRLCETCARDGFSLYFLGARPGIAEKAAARLKGRHPNLQIVGTHHGYFDKTLGSPENEAVVEAINAVKPNILIVGFGMPIQERWLMENWDRIDANVALTAGAMFDYISGELRRGPRWMTDHGLEWLARLIIEPRRLWKRYLIGNPLFLWRVLKQRFGLLRLPEDV